jgi:hypothetical protein
MTADQPGRVFALLVADALEALLPLVDEWARDVDEQRLGGHGASYAAGYEAGVRRMAAEFKDQLVARILELRQLGP